MATLLITRPDHDLTNVYFFHWSKKVIDFAIKKTHKVLILDREKAVLKVLTSYISRNNPSFIFLNGHGNKNCITGHLNEKLFDSNTDSRLVKNKIFYARSCNAGAVLGPLLIKKGAKAFIGYVNKFWVYLEENKTTRPLQDRMAKMFLEPSNLIATTLLKGNTVGKAHENSVKKMKKNLSFLLSNKAGQEGREAAVLLWNNISGQRVIGDNSAII